MGADTDSEDSDDDADLIGEGGDHFPSGENLPKRVHAQNGDVNGDQAGDSDDGNDLGPY